MNNNTSNQTSTAHAGFIFGIFAYLIWGLSPIYWKELHTVSSVQVVLHRIIWSFFFLLPLIFIQGHWSEFVQTFKRWKTLGILFFTAVLISVNWVLYIWAVNNDYVLQASLGYYINPLVNVLLGTVFLKERLRRLQLIAVGLAFAGVLFMTLFLGQFPWISLTLAFSFGFYALTKKMISVSSSVGLTIETLILTVPAVAYVMYLDAQGTSAFLHQGIKIDILLIGAALMTALPLLLFTLAARRLSLITIGFMQYMAPTCIFFLGVLVYKEPFVYVQIVTFVCIWIALIIFSVDSFLTYKR